MSATTRCSQPLVAISNHSRWRRLSQRCCWCAPTTRRHCNPPPYLMELRGRKQFSCSPSPQKISSPTPPRPLRSFLNFSAVLPLPLIQSLIPSLPLQPIKPLKLIPTLLHHPLSAKPLNYRELISPNTLKMWPLQKNTIKLLPTLPPCHPLPTHWFGLHTRKVSIYYPV